MIDDFVPIIHRLDGRPIKLYAIGDVHLGAKEADVRGLEKFLKKVESEDDSYIVIVGDMLNNGTRDSLTNVYEEVLPPSAQVDLAAELLAPVAGKILGAVGGNHEYRSVKAVDLDPLYQVMVILHVPDLYRQSFAFLRITLEKGNVIDSYAIYLTHGKSAAKQKKFAQGALEGVDAIIQGHTHEGSIQKSTRMVFTQQSKVKFKSIVSITAASWLRYGGYAAKGQYLPTASAADGPQALLLDFTGSNQQYGNIQVVW